MKKAIRRMKERRGLLARIRMFPKHMNTFGYSVRGVFVPYMGGDLSNKDLRKALKHGGGL